MMKFERIVSLVIFSCCINIIATKSVEIERIESGDRIKNSPFCANCKCSSLERTYYNGDSRPPICIYSPAYANCYLVLELDDGREDFRILTITEEDINNKVIRVSEQRTCSAPYQPGPGKVLIQSTETETEWLDITEDGTVSFDHLEFTITKHIPGVLMKVYVSCHYQSTIDHPDRLCLLLRFSGNITYGDKPQITTSKPAVSSTTALKVVDSTISKSSSTIPVDPSSVATSHHNSVQHHNTPSSSISTASLFNSESRSLFSRETLSTQSSLTTLKTYAPSTNITTTSSIFNTSHLKGTSYHSTHKTYSPTVTLSITVKPNGTSSHITPSVTKYSNISTTLMSHSLKSSIDGFFSVTAFSHNASYTPPSSNSHQGTVIISTQLKSSSHAFQTPSVRHTPSLHPTESLPTATHLKTASPSHETRPETRHHQSSIHQTVSETVTPIETASPSHETATETRHYQFSMGFIKSIISVSPSTSISTSSSIIATSSSIISTSSSIIGDTGKLQDDDDNSEIELIGGLCAAAIFSIVIVYIIILLICRRKKERKHEIAKALDVTFDDELAIEGPVNRKQATLPRNEPETINMTITTHNNEVKQDYDSVSKDVPDGDSGFFADDVIPNSVNDEYVKTEQDAPLALKDCNSDSESEIKTDSVENEDVSDLYSRVNRAFQGSLKDLEHEENELDPLQESKLGHDTTDGKRTLYTVTI